MSLQTLNENLDIIQNLVIPFLEDDLDNIQKLDDEPNDVGGLSAAQLKAEFDKSGNTIKKYLNETLIPQLSDTVAEAEVRATAERERVANENIRIGNENVRIENEDARQENETARVNAEKARAAAETERQMAESGRTSAEEGRVLAEQDRIAEERARVLAEQARADENTGIVAQATTKAKEAADSAAKAKKHEENATLRENNAYIHSVAAGVARDNAKTSETNAKTSETNAKTSEGKAKTSENNAKDSETKAKASESNAKASESNAKASEDEAKRLAETFDTEALDARIKAKGDNLDFDTETSLLWLTSGGERIGDGIKVSDDDVTAENIGAALGYAPAKQTDVDRLSNEKVDKPPVYVVAEASAVVDKALSRDDSRVFRFIAFSDAHQKNDDTNISGSNRDAGLGMAELHRLIGIDLTAFLGDSCWGSTTDTIAETLEQAKQFNRYFGDALKGETQIRIEGNHDDANYAADGSADVAELTPSDMYGLFYAYNKGMTFDPDRMTEGYGYQDFPNHKVRVVALNTNQGLGEGGVMDGQQLRWFAETALDMTGKTDWQLMILSHHPLDYPAPTLYYDACRILEAFIKGRSVSITTRDTSETISVDYDGKNSTFIANFHGHVHAFSVVELEKYVSSGVYDGIGGYAVSIPNACFTRSNQHVSNSNERFRRYSTPTTYNKTVGTAQSTSFNLITVCLDKKIVYADCYGAGVDRVLAYGEIPVDIYTITRNLTRCTSSSTVTSVTEETSHAETLTAATGYTLDGATVTVTMGGVDITASAYSNGVLTIPSVTGDIVITVVAVEIPPAYTNLLPTAIGTDGSIYNGTGYKENARLSGSGTETTGTNIALTGFMPIGYGSSNAAVGEQVVYIENAEVVASGTDVRLCLYTADKTFIGIKYGRDFVTEVIDGSDALVVTKDNNGYITSVDVTRYSFYLHNTGKDTAFFRLCGAGIDSDTIITVNEPIE